MPPGIEPLVAGGGGANDGGPATGASAAVGGGAANGGGPATGASAAVAVADPSSRIRWGRVLLVSMSGIISHTFGRSTVAVLLPAMSDDLDLSSTVAGALGSINLGSYFFGVVAVTFLARRVEPFTLLRIGIGIVALGLLVLSTANTTATVLIGTGLGGLGGAGIWLTVPIIVTEGVPGRRRGLVMGTLTATMGAGFIAVPIATTLFRNLSGDDGIWRPVWLWEMCGAALLLALLTLLVRAKPTSGLGAGGGLALLRSFVGWKRAVVAYMAFAWIAASFGQFLGLALEEEHGFSREFATLLYSLMGVGSLVGAISFGRLSDNMGRSRTMALVMIIAGISALAVPYGGAAIIGVSVVLFGSTAFAYPALTAAFVNDRVSDRSFSSVFGTMTMFYGPASVAGPALSGWLIDRTDSYAATYWIVCALALLAALCMGTLPRHDVAR